VSTEVGFPRKLSKVNNRNQNRNRNFGKQKHRNRNSDAIAYWFRRNFDVEIGISISISIPTPEFWFWYKISIQMSTFQSIFHCNKSKILFRFFIGISISTVEIVEYGLMCGSDFCRKYETDLWKLHPMYPFRFRAGSMHGVHHAVRAVHARGSWFFFNRLPLLHDLHGLLAAL
jgi:hypothetical protein